MIVRRFSLVLASVVVCLFALGAAAALPQAAAATASVGAYRGLGTWVDMYDAAVWDAPQGPIEDMVAHGVRTIYLETSNYHWSTPLNQPDAMGALLDAAHAHELKVVAWYLPGFDDPTRDFARSKAAIEFTSPTGEKFDSFALDIEATIVKDVDVRTRRLRYLSKRIRTLAGDQYPLGAITPSPAGLKLHSTVWPNFPYKALAELYNVFVPMGYYTYHGDGYDNAYRDTRDNIRIIRQKTGLPTVPIHVIAGDAAQSSASETLAYVRALRECGALGGSMYDWATTSDANWQVLQAVHVNPVQSVAMPVALPATVRLGNIKADRSHPKEVFYETGGQAGARVLRFRIYDAQTGEVRLIVNWRDLGLIVKGPSQTWSKVRKIEIPASVLKAGQPNVIGFVAVGDYPRWTSWGVRDVELKAPPTAAP